VSMRDRTAVGDALAKGGLPSLIVAALLCTSPARSQQTAEELRNLSVAGLMSMEVTSASKKEQKISRVATAIFVITQQDIRDSGATNIPDMLRMVPGLDVAQINANTWAVSARGFNHQFSDKLLVLIDGRAVYTPLFGGVYWDTQDVPLEDIDRIEVIRGPGATVWGANAVNGVINIITKKAGDTQGSLVTGGGGTQEQAFGTVQYGGKFKGLTSYRAFVKYLDRNHFPDLNGQNAMDGWHLLHSGVRTDTTLSKSDSVTVQGDIYSGSEGAIIGHIASIDPPVNVNVQRVAELSGGNVLGRWDHNFSSRSDTTLQLYFDRYTRSGPESHEVRNTFDLDFQHHLALGTRQDLIWGAGYRRSADRTVGTIDQGWIPPDRTLQLFSMFVQDEITLRPDRLFLTVGTKVEHNDFNGFEIEPSARVAWTPTARHTFWAAVSDAARTPSRVDANGEFPLAAFPGTGGTPAELILFGNPHEKSDYLLATEAGYRVQPSARVSVDLSLFYNRYRDLRSTEPHAVFFDAGPVPHLEIPLVYDNKLHGTTHGIEFATKLKVTNYWTLSPGYALLQMHLHTDATSQDTTNVADIQGSNPRHQAQLRSHIELGRGLAWDASAYFVASLPAQQLPSYTRLDTQLRWLVGERTELTFGGQNLLKDHHLESNDTGTSVNSSQVKRSAYVKFVWRF
jgi:iron complex outermembrane receptor protein